MTQELKDFLKDRVIKFLNLVPIRDENTGEYVYEEEDLIEFLIESAFQFVQNYLKVPLEEDDYIITKKVKHLHSNIIFLPFLNIRNLEIEIGGVPLEEVVDYEVNKNSVIIYDLSNYDKDDDIVISFTAGYAGSLPEDITQAICHLVTVYYKHRDPSLVTFNSTGQTGFTIDYGRVPSVVFTLLNSYRNIGAY